MKKIISIILINCSLLHLTGCYSMQTISPLSLSNQASNPHLVVFLDDGRRIEFQENNYSIVTDTIKGIGTIVSNITPVSSVPLSYNIPVSSVKYASIEQYDSGSTILVSGLIIGVVIFAVSTKIPFASK